MTPISRRSILRLSLGALAAVPLALMGARPALAATHQVQIKGFKFRPASLSVAVGDIVQFTNVDSAPHTATATSGAFDTGTIKRGATASVTVGSAGAHAFKCKFHPNMKGTISAA